MEIIEDIFCLKINRKVKRKSNGIFEGGKKKEFYVNLENFFFVENLLINFN